MNKIIFISKLGSGSMRISTMEREDDKMKRIRNRENIHVVGRLLA